jgi:hypothetical protein
MFQNELIPSPFPEKTALPPLPVSGKPINTTSQIILQSISRHLPDSVYSSSETYFQSL